jgi:hypothetical protein
MTQQAMCGSVGYREAEATPHGAGFCLINKRYRMSLVFDKAY